MKSIFEINGWKLPINEGCQSALTEREKEFGCIATDLDLTYFIENKPPSNKKVKK